MTPCSRWCGYCGRCDDGVPTVERTCIVCKAPFLAPVDSEYQLHIMCPACTVAAVYAEELRDRKHAS